MEKIKKIKQWLSDKEKTKQSDWTNTGLSIFDNLFKQGIPPEKIVMLVGRSNMGQAIAFEPNMAKFLLSKSRK